MECVHLHHLLATFSCDRCWWRADPEAAAAGRARGWALSSLCAIVAPPLCSFDPPRFSAHNLAHACWTGRWLAVKRY